MKIKKKQAQRREFIKTVAAVGASTSFLGCVNPFKGRSLSSEEVEKIYDYIVVGTGAGGGPLAARLALLGHSVLCIEAGFDHADDDGKSPVEMSTPAYHALSTEHPDWSWNYYVRHNNGQKKNALGALNADTRDSKYVKDEGGILYPRASGIGGCTTHHAMITMVPDNKDWSDIQKLSGDNSWDPKNMRRYFQKIENKVGQPHSNVGRKDGEGWLSTSQGSLKFLFNDLFGNPFDGKFIKNPFARLTLANANAWQERFAEELGKKTPFNFYGKNIKRDVQILKDIMNGAKKGFLSLDANAFSKGPKAEGLYRVMSAIDAQGKRSGPKDWLLSVSKRSDLNLDIVTGHLAAEVLFEPIRGEQKRRALGVKCLVSRKTNLYKASPNFEKLTTQETRVYKAKKEVILAGGAFNTPQLLMLSGIGRKDHLESKGIPIKINLPAVGQNLQDRYEVGVVSELEEGYDQLKDCTFDPSSDPCLDSYHDDPSNSLYATNGVIIGNMVRSRFSRKNPNEDPDLFVFAVPGEFKGYYPGWSKNATKNNKMTWAVLKAKTSNTNGSVELKSKDPTQTPDINFNNFTDNKNDLLAVLDGVNFARRVNMQTPLKKLLKAENFPGKEVNDPAALTKFISQEAWGHHASCTCPMGRSVSNSVVDFNFKVHQTTNLRVVDASVFPKIPGHFLVAPIYMVAEKAAEVIHRDSKKG